MLQIQIFRQQQTNKPMKSKIIYFLILMVYCSINAQNKQTLNIEQVLQIVRQYHPIVKQAQIGIQKTQADITIARASFNPIIATVISNKTFGSEKYYDYVSPSITVPTWYGIEVTSGIETLSGNRFDPSETVGQSSYIGVSVPLLKNLVIDKRRAFLKQSKLYNEMARTQQLSINNDILMEAAAQYWEWVNAYQSYQIILKNLEISQKRYEMIKKMVQNGERPGIETIEAQTQYQGFEYQKNESFYNYQKSSIALSAFLWAENNLPYQLPDNVTPQIGWDNELAINSFNLVLTDLVSSALKFHPDLLIYNQKLDVLEIDKKLKFQELLPKLDLKYNHLNKGNNPVSGSGFLLNDNFNYGVKFEMPLFFSNGRGEYGKAKLKIQEAKIAQNQKTQNLELKIKNYYIEFETLKSQITLQKNMLSNFEKLLKAEETLFLNGESSLFLINSRENKVLENEKKLVELKTKYYKTIYALQWSSGLLK